MKPDFQYELGHGRDQGILICGVDEVGRGPLAGPVVAAAVVLPVDKIYDWFELLDDSKKVPLKTRLLLFDHITRECSVGIASQSPAQIDQINILQASLEAMRMAVEALPIFPRVALIDGNKKPIMNCKCIPIVKGDTKSRSIAAASIVAKVTRDKCMQELALQYPDYSWHSNKGYPTKAHKAALANLGVTPHHRRTFAPVREILEKQ